MTTSGERIAIVGAAGRFPGSGADLDLFWENIVQARDCSREVPDGRWAIPADQCYDARVPHPDSVYSPRGYFLDPFVADLEGTTANAEWLAGLDPLFHLVLDVGNRAWRSAKTDTIDRRRVGAILGNICLPTEKASDLAREYLGTRFGIEQTEPSMGLNRYPVGLPAGLLAKALGLGGGTFTLDAACASSLYAIKLAADELLSGRADAMLAGGCSRPDSLYTQMGFAQLRALSQSGRCSPFDAQADGLVVGEGAGIFVLKRLSDALAHGDTILATLAGWGLSNDVVGNLLAPSVEGQLRAMREAYRRADWTPSDVDLIECHATGTPIGDAIEFESLAELWRGHDAKPGQCVIGSVKATVGHLLTGAGAAATMKVLRAMAARTLPPQANFAAPGANLRYDGSPFRVLTAAEPWRTDSPRRAAVSGFGFGGVNAHLLLEEWTDLAIAPKSVPVSELRKKANDGIAVVGMAAHIGPWKTLRAFQERIFGGDEDTLPTPKTSGWTSEENPTPGFFLDDIAVPLDRFRIPPKELEEMLPQQLLALVTAAAAIDDCTTARETDKDHGDPMTGVFVGLGLDLNATNYHLRWAAKAVDATQADAVGPALNANRVMGALGSIAASRIARAFRFGGPSFTVCSEETSAGRALELAVRALRAGELDRTVVGGVELVGDPRAMHATAADRPFSPDGQPMPFGRFSFGSIPGEGAAAVVLKRLADAERDGDRIYAVLRGVGVASGGAMEAVVADSATYASSLLRACSDAQIDPASIGYLDASASGTPCEDRIEAEALAALLKATTRTMPLEISAAKAQVGHTGFASVLVAVVKASLSLYHQILPAIPSEERRSELDLVTADCHFPNTPRYWLQDRAAGLRRAAVAGVGVDGSCVHAVLEEHAEEKASKPQEVERQQPLGARREAVFAIEGDTTAELIDGLGRLTTWLPDGVRTIESLARDWFRRVPVDVRRKLAVTLLARSTAELKEQIAFAVRAITARPETAIPDPKAGDLRPAIRDRVFFNPYPIGRNGKVAFVFPGSGNPFAGMGRDFGTEWPGILRRQQSENALLRSQFAPNRFWESAIPLDTTAREFLFGQVTLGTLTTDLLVSLGLKADALIGQSLGESAGLFGLRLWTNRDEMYRRIQESSLFGTDLGPPFNAARAQFGTPETSPLDWVSGVVPVAPDDVRLHLRPDLHAYLLIVTAPNECVIGGVKADVETLVAALGQRFLLLDGVTLAHCEAGRPVEAAYRELHRLPVTAPSGLRVYSGAWGREYKVTEAAAADSITAGLLHTIDFPAVVESAYRDGIRAFVEVGPGKSCTRTIRAILGERPHAARAVCFAGQDAATGVLKLFAELIAERVPISLGKLYGMETMCVGHTPTTASRLSRNLIVRTGAPVPYREPEPSVFVPEIVAPELPPEVVAPLTQTPPPPLLPPVAVPSRIDLSAFVTAAGRTAEVAAEAHAKYLHVSDGFTQTAIATLQLQTQIIERMQRRQPRVTRVRTEVPRALSFDDCTTYANGKIADVLGASFAEIDTFPTRVRLPAGPLMLVDRVLRIEGEPKSMTSGRVVTDHTVRADRWYLDNNRCPTSVTVESGQADLFLSGFLGIDFQTRGLAVYRLLDAVVTFHRGLPKVGERIEYDIYIDEFFHQAGAWLFRFHFEGSIDGQPLLSMQSGIAGFFTAEALAAGVGIVHTKLDKQPTPGKRPPDWTDWVSSQPIALGEAEVEALRRGEIAAAFGADFAKLNLHAPMKLPGGMLRLVDRVPVVDPNGGRFGLGFVRAEYDIRPKEWFIECHFIDDKVMPGTLMYECCLHTLRVLLMRIGWIGEEGEVVCQPVPDVKSRLKCRGQVLASTRTVTYEVSIKELGYGPEPYAIGDALMYADGKPIVEITNLSLRMTGLTRERLEAIWSRKRPYRYDNASIMAYSNGNPSEAFGEPYRIFDRERMIARLPGPPYQFIDGITEVTGEPFVLKAGASCVAEYRVPPDAWYFEANRCPRMPFSILLEIALQPCGWLAAYCGSALTSPSDMSFRNLGGKAVQLEAVGPDAGLLTTTVTMSKVSSSGGMIIQHYDLCVRQGERKVYEGTTYFGFFGKAALVNQVGMPNAKLPVLQPGAIATKLPRDAPFPGPMLRMVDTIDGYEPDGGAKRLGLIGGRIAVDASFWFFKAHFYQDPVWPGSLGLESFLQLFKFVAWKKWGAAPPDGWQTVARNHTHEWTYRGQVVPTDREVTVLLEIVEEDTIAKSLTANGFLIVDGRIIYQMTGFTLE